MEGELEQAVTEKAPGKAGTALHCRSSSSWALGNADALGPDDLDRTAQSKAFIRVLDMDAVLVLSALVLRERGTAPQRLDLCTYYYCGWTKSASRTTK